MTQTPDDDLIRRVIDCVMEVHSQTGPGLSKNVYEACMAVELATAGITFESGRVLPLIYDGCELDFRCETDLIVNQTLLLQIEAEDMIDLAQEQKLRTCLWMGGFPSGLLVNFNVLDMADGITHMAATATAEPFAIVDVFEDPELGSTF